MINYYWREVLRKLDSYYCFQVFHLWFHKHFCPYLKDTAYRILRGLQ